MNECWPLLVLVGAIMLIIWLYVAARVVAFGVLKSLFTYKWNIRSMDDGKRNTKRTEETQGAKRQQGTDKGASNK